MTDLDRLWTAVNESDPTRSLRSVVVELSSAGTTTPVIQKMLETLLQESRGSQTHGEAKEDAILDVLDSLAGWCHANARLLPDSNAK